MRGPSEARISRAAPAAACRMPAGESAPPLGFWSLPMPDSRAMTSTRRPSDKAFCKAGSRCA